MTGLASLVGIPWKSGGRSTDGIDCVGLAALAQAVLWGREYPVPEGYDPERDTEREPFLLEWVRSFARECASPVVGGLVVLRLRFAGTEYLHIGTIVEPGEFLQIFPGGTSRISRFADKYRARITACFEPEGEEAIGCLARP